MAVAARRPISDEERQAAREAAALAAWPLPPVKFSINRPRDSATATRFWAKVDRTDACWIWTGAVIKGKARFSLDGRSMMAARVALAWEQGLLPEGVVRQACGDGRCVRPDPDHAWLDTSRRRGRPGLEVCPEGHPKTRLRADGIKVCVTCHDKAQAAWKRRQKA